MNLTFVEPSDLTPFFSLIFSFFSNNCLFANLASYEPGLGLPECFPDSLWDMWVRYNTLWYFPSPQDNGHGRKYSHGNNSLEWLLEIQTCNSSLLWSLIDQVSASITPSNQIVRLKLLCNSFLKRTSRKPEEDDSSWSMLGTYSVFSISLFWILTCHKHRLTDEECNFYRPNLVQGTSSTYMCIRCQQLDLEIESFDSFHLVTSDVWSVSFFIVQYIFVAWFYLYSWHFLLEEDQTINQTCQRTGSQFNVVEIVFNIMSDKLFRSRLTLKCLSSL